VKIAKVIDLQLKHKTLKFLMKNLNTIE